MTNPYAPPQAAVLDVADIGSAAILADRGTRLAAAILDGLIFFAMVYLPIVATGVGAGLARANRDAAGSALAIGIGLTCIGLAVWSWLTIRYVLANGQSIGKKITGIKVARTDGSRASLGRIFWLRNVVNGLISIIPLYGIIDALFIFAESRQCLHDKIADTIVINV